MNSLLQQRHIHLPPSPIHASPTTTTKPLLGASSSSSSARTLPSPPFFKGSLSQLKIFQDGNLHSVLFYDPTKAFSTYSWFRWNKDNNGIPSVYKFTNISFFTSDMSTSERDYILNGLPVSDVIYGVIKNTL